MSEAEVQDLHKRIRIEWLDSLNANEYDSLSRSRALDSLSLFCAKHEVNSIRIAREEAQAKRLPINWRSNKEVIALVRMQVKDAREEGFNSKFEVMALYTKAKKEVEVRVREEMINKFKSFLKKHEVMFFGCDCSDCQTMEDDFEEKFLIKTGVQKE